MTTWSISAMERNASDDGVVVAHWRVVLVDGEYSSSAYGTCSFTPDPTSDDFIAFDDLKEADVIGWVHTELDAEHIEASLAADIAQQKAPTILTGTPW